LKEAVEIAGHPGPHALNILTPRALIYIIYALSDEALQQKKIMGCPECRLSFTVLTIPGGKNVTCPRC
jgi:uncharacterized paraquat-inducible protein A